MLSEPGQEWIAALTESLVAVGRAVSDTTPSAPKNTAATEFLQDVDTPPEYLVKMRDLIHSTLYVDHTSGKDAKAGRHETSHPTSPMKLIGFLPPSRRLHASDAQRSELAWRA